MQHVVDLTVLKYSTLRQKNTDVTIGVFYMNLKKFTFFPERLI